MADDEERRDPKEPDLTGETADAYAPPPRDPAGRNKLLTGALVIAAIAVVVFLVLLIVGD